MTAAEALTTVSIFAHTLLSLIVDWLNLIFCHWGLLSLSSVLGDCMPEPTEDTTTAKQEL